VKFGESVEILYEVKISANENKDILRIYYMVAIRVSAYSTLKVPRCYLSI
jgi:hypothetical protein